MLNQYRWYLASIQKEWKKSPDGAAVQKYPKQILKQWYLHYWHAPRGARGVKNCTLIILWVYFNYFFFSVSGKTRLIIYLSCWIVGKEFQLGRPNFNSIPWKSQSTLKLSTFSWWSWGLFGQMHCALGMSVYVLQEQLGKLHSCIWKMLTIACKTIQKPH